MSQTTRVKLGAFEAHLFWNDISTIPENQFAKQLAEKLDDYNKNDEVFEPGDVQGNFDLATNIFAEAASPNDRIQADRYKNIVQVVNLADQLARRARLLKALRPNTHLGFFVKWEIEFDHESWQRALQQFELDKIPSLLQSLKELTDKPEALTIPNLFVPCESSYRSNYYDLCRISSSIFLTPLLKLKENIDDVRGFDLIDRNYWVVELECEDYLLRCPSNDEFRIPHVSFGIDESCSPHGGGR